MTYKKLSKVLCLLVLAISANAADTDNVKQGILSSMTSGISSSIAEMIGGEGDTEVQFSAKEITSLNFQL